MQNSATITINAQRFQKLFDEQSRFGKVSNSGVNRPAFGSSHIELRKWLAAKAGEYGLSFNVDNAGNHFLTYQSKLNTGKTILIGSHLDSVTNGGVFDGALGVIAGLEVLITLKENNIDIPYNIAVVDFSDEEGNWLGLLGSRAFTGLLTEEEIRLPRGGYEQLIVALGKIGLSPETLISARGDIENIAAYFELHIEQGTRLEKASVDIGIVENIVGVCSYKLKFIGRADHAGTIGMNERLDAGRGAARFILEARKLVVDNFYSGVVNVGQIDFEPGSFNIVPSEAAFALEFRSPEKTQFDEMEKALLGLGQTIAREENLAFQAELRGKHAPAPMAPEIMQAFEEGALSSSLSTMKMQSFAGHDAQSLAKFVPTGMIFVPSVDGASHSPREFTKWLDCVNGANALLNGVLRFINTA